MSRAFWVLESVLLPVQPVLKEKLKEKSGLCLLYVLSSIMYLLY